MIWLKKEEFSPKRNLDVFSFWNLQFVFFSVIMENMYINAWILLE